MFSARNRARLGKVVSFEYLKEDRRVGMYYFYILDPQFGPGFINWITQIPTPLGVDDRAVGYWWELSMRQVEVSRTLVLDDPRRARLFFEALLQDNIGIGRPEEISLVFARPPRRPTRHPYRTRIFSSGPRSGSSSATSTPASSSTSKAAARSVLRTVINTPSDLGLPSRLHHLPALVDKARAVSQRLLMTSKPARAVPSAPRSTSASTSPTPERANEPERCASGIQEL